MSEIRVTTLTDTSGGNASTSAEIYSGRAKAWVNFNGTGTVAIRANFNVNTITDRGTGKYTVNFSSALPDADYTVTATNEIQENVAAGWCGAPAGGRATSSCQIDSINAGFAGFDRAQCGVVFCR